LTKLIVKSLGSGDGMTPKTVRTVTLKVSVAY